MKSEYQLLVIGAGPAGMAAATSAARHGVEVAVVDEQAQPGGQVYRNVDASPLADLSPLGGDYEFGKPLVQAFRYAGVDYHAATSLWYLDGNRQVGLLKDGKSHRIDAQRVIVASGAQERPMPFPGWQLPGVLGAGGAQVLLKSAALVPADGVVLAGSGPLLLLLAWQYLRAGVKIRALLETTPKANRPTALRHLPAAFAAPGYLLKGLRLQAAIRRARVPVYSSVGGLRADGDERLRRVEFEHGGVRETVETGLLLVQQGIIPELHTLQAAGCEIEWNEAQQSWRPRLDAWGESSRAGIFAAGDCAAIGGARAAESSAKIAALRVANQLGLVDDAGCERLVVPLRRAQARHLAIRPFLDAYYRVADEFLAPPDAALVCRCEEVDAGRVRAAITLGCSGPNQLKAFTRCGMGACQGRFCAATVEHIFARERGISVSEIGRYNARPPLKPITLGQLASSGFPEEEQQ